MPLRTSMTEIRPRLSELLAQVVINGEQVVITRFGKPVAALVPMDDLRRIWNDQDEERVGPINPHTGRAFGPAWVEALWQGRYRREDDPDAHLHPSREEAPWLGKPFPWPPEPDDPEPEPEPDPEAEPAPPATTPDAAEEPASAPEAPAPAPARRRGWLARVFSVVRNVKAN